jgi:hypothetical protein
MDDPYLVFVPGQPLLFAAERGRSVLLLRCPELEVERTMETPPDRKLDVVKASPDGRSIGGFFHVSSFRSGGTLRVWRTTGETQLVLDDASAAFEFFGNNQLIVWQPKSGITQWQLGEGEATRTGPAITTATNVQVNVGSNGFYLSPDGRYLLTNGVCHGDDPKTDDAVYCLYDLHDGATVGWSAEDPESMNGTGFTRQFTELLLATNIDTSGPNQEACKKVAPNRELCVGPGAASLIESAQPPENHAAGPSSSVASATVPKEVPPAPPPAPPAANPPARPSFKDVIRQLKELKNVPKAVAEKSETEQLSQAAAGKVRRVLWTIRAGEEFGRFINSCAVSTDGRWAALATNGVTVLLFDTAKLQPKSSVLYGDWQEPTLVKQIEMP